MRRWNVSWLQIVGSQWSLRSSTSTCAFMLFPGVVGRPSSRSLTAVPVPRNADVRDFRRTNSRKPRRIADHVSRDRAGGTAIGDRHPQLIGEVEGERDGGRCRARVVDIRALRSPRSSFPAIEFRRVAASHSRMARTSLHRQIAVGLGTGSQQLNPPVTKLLASKKLRKTGQKRGTQYFAGGGRGATKAKARRGRKAKRSRKARRKKA